MLTVEVGKPLPRHPTYDSDALARAFWRLTFHTGRKYVDGLDALGKPVVPPHEREKEGYLRRKQLTKPRNHAGPLIRRYNDHVFRRDAERTPKGETPDPTYAQIIADADGKGTTLPDFFKRCLLQAQIERESYILPDSNAPADGTLLTQAQADADGVRMFLRRIAPDSVIWWRDHDGMLVEAIVLLVDDDGNEFARQFDVRSYRDLKLKPTNGTIRERFVEGIGPDKQHNAGGCPLVRLRPLFTGDDECGESQIAPMAQSQQAITNLLSLLTEEIYNVTFSQMVASGVSAEQVKDVYVGNNRLLCLPNPAAKVDMIGADPTQAATIAQAIMDEQRELYRIAGVDAGSTSQTAGAGAQPESGIAKAFKHNDLAANLSALANAVQQAENLALRRLFAQMGKPAPAPVSYPKEFDLPSLGDELGDVIRAITIPQLPKVLKRKQVAQFASRNFELSDDEQTELDAELQTIGDEPVDPLAGRTPGT